VFATRRGGAAELRWTGAGARQQSRPHEYSHPVPVPRHDGPRQAGCDLPEEPVITGLPTG